jgi:hypothetical protein
MLLSSLADYLRTANAILKVVPRFTYEILVFIRKETHPYIQLQFDDSYLDEHYCEDIF